MAPAQREEDVARRDLAAVGAEPRNLSDPPARRRIALRSRISPSAPHSLPDLVRVVAVAELRQQRERLRRELARRSGTPSSGCDAADQRAGDAAGVVGGGVIAAVAGRRLRLVVDHHVEIFRLVGRRDRHEGREHLVVGIAAVDDLLRGAGLAADVIALDVGEARRAMRRVGAHEIAHRLRGLRADDAMARRHRVRLVAREERRLRS